MTYIGNRELLVYPDYLDYYNGTPGNIKLSVGSLHLSAYGAENDLPAVPLDWDTVIDGQGNDVTDILATVRSLVATGPSSLAAFKIIKPPPTAPPPRVRAYELMSLPDWYEDNNWVLSGNPAAGGLPELSWLGDNDFIMAVQIETAETGDPALNNRWWC